MKREYVTPTAVCETFASNEYVATCGKTPDGKYIFKCDAPAGNVWTSETTKLGGYEPCGKTHVTEGTGNYYSGWVDYNKNNVHEAGEDALIWVERFWGVVYDYHASASLTPEEIDVVRS